MVVSTVRADMLLLYQYRCHRCESRTAPYWLQHDCICI